ncbi:SMI1/KNR4 family protein [Paenibacillus rhizoplanae]
MYEHLTEKLSKPSAIRWFRGHGAQESWIAEAEAELGFKLPPSYRWWLIHYGNGGGTWRRAYSDACCSRA